MTEITAAPASPTAEPAPAATRRSWLGLLKRHSLFILVFSVGTVLRIVTMIGYPPAMWFNDSFDYLDSAVHLYPHELRPDGYSFFLRALEPLHSFVLVVAVQHALGLACALLVYLLLVRRFGTPKWIATLCAAPVLLDAYQIQLEQLIMSDTQFEFLTLAAIVLVLWWAKPSWRVGAAVGLIIGMVSLTRSLGPAVLAAVALYLLIRRTNWRVLVALVVCCAAPILGYSAWYHSVHGKFATTGTSGIFLYSRVGGFADCGKIPNLPTAEIPLCVVKPPKFSANVIWDFDSPLLKNSPDKWSEYQNSLANDFSKRAIMAQPGDYLKLVASDFFRTFWWSHPVFPDKATFREYQFRAKPQPVPAWKEASGATAQHDVELYAHSGADTNVVQPFGKFMETYQKYVFLRGAMLAVILLVGLAGMLPLWRRFGGRALLPWLTTVGLLLAPAATAEFDYRYVLPTVPLAGIAAGLAFSPESLDAFRRAGGRLRRRRPQAAAAPTEA